MSDEITESAPFNFLKMSTLLGRKKKQGPDKKYATFRRRLWAATIDSIILLLATPLFNRWFPIKVPAVPLDGSDPQATQRLVQGLTNSDFISSWLINMTAQMMAFCLFSAICWYFWSATPGKMALFIKIVDAKTEQHITDRQILIRILGYFVSSLCFFLGFFWISFDKRRQGWHDKMADTIVVVVPWKQSSFGRLFTK